MKTAVLLPGVGYTHDRPLLYYAAKLAARRGYELIRLSYRDLPYITPGDADAMARARETAFDRIAAELNCRALDNETLFISKSIGTALALDYAALRGLDAAHLLYTPVAGSFEHTKAVRALAFHGTADPWADTPSIRAACERLSIPLDVTPGANHSLETGDVDLDIAALKRIMNLSAAFIDSLSQYNH